MPRATVVPLLLSGARAIALTVADVGNVTTRWGPVVPKRSEIANRFRVEIGGEAVFRGVVVEVGQPVVTGNISAVYAGGGIVVLDTYTLVVTAFDGTIDSDTAYSAALDRALALSDAFETTWSYPGLAISQVDPPEIRSFDLAEVAGRNAWTAVMELRVTIERQEQATLA